MKSNKILAGLVLAGFAIASCTDSQDQTESTMAIDTSSVPTQGYEPQVSGTPSTDTVVMTDTARTSRLKTNRKPVIATKTYTVDKNAKMEVDVEGYYPYAEVMPSFKGGEAALRSWLEKTLVYPQDAIDNGVEGDVLLRFSVDENGKVYPPTVVGNRIGYGLEDAAIAAVNKMPAWNPGVIKGKNVKTKFTLPVSFQLQ